MKTNVELKIEEEIFEVILKNSVLKKINFEESLYQIIKFGCLVVMSSSVDEEIIEEKFLN